MNWNAYVLDLAQQPDAGGHLDLDRTKELAYVREHSFRFRTLTALIDQQPIGNGRVLDVGPTPFTIFLRRKFPAAEVWAVDRTDMLAQRFARDGVQLKVADLDNVTLPFDDAFFDLIVFTEVLEHVFAPHSLVLKELHRLLRPDGRLLLSVPNIAVLHKRIRLLLGRSPLPPADDQFKKDWVHGHGHVHEYTAREIAGLVRNCGFDIRRVRLLRPGLSDVMRHPNAGILERILRSIYWSAQSVWPTFAAQILVDAQRK